MKRKEIETLMKKAGAKYISLVFNETDQLGMLCQMQNGALCDCWGSRISLKQDVWGIIVHEQGKPVHYPIEEKINEVLFCK